MIHISQNIQRAILLTPTTGNMAADIVSDIVDFKDMTSGSIQVKWEGNDQDNGEIIAEVSNIPEDSWFDRFGSTATFVMNDNGIDIGKKKTRLFNFGWLGFRYARIRYLKGTNTTGTLQVMALGKKGS
jgi:hypothetical protein